jgi:catechol-2,3-dioxygenase
MYQILERFFIQIKGQNMAIANNNNAEAESSDNIHNGQDYRSLLHPKYMAHFGLRTTPQKFDEMVDWHLKFFGGRLVLKSAEAAMIAYDDEHHRLVIVKAPDHEAAGNKKAMCGFYHIAFAFESLADLVTAYEQKKALGILPHWPVNHGMSTSLYYSDPDGNEFEINVDNFDTAAEAHAFMQTDEYLQNPIGVDFDAEVLVQRVRSGEDEQSIKKRPVIGKRLNRWENSMYFKPEDRFGK